MKTVHEILQKKGHDVWSVAPGDSIYEALRIMNDKNIGAVLVSDSSRILGIFSERDYARKVVLEGRSSRKTAVQEAMTHKVAFVRPDQTVEECMALMTDKRIRHLPVLEESTLVGVVSIGDVVRAKISEQEFMIGLLENYITAR
jgi:CBS domain-containing protein